MNCFFINNLKLVKYRYTVNYKIIKDVILPIINLNRVENTKSH